MEEGSDMTARSRHRTFSILSEGDKDLLNVNHGIGVNPAIHDRINVNGANAFIQVLLDPSTQDVIGEFGVDRFGQPRFTPCADNSCGIEPPATPVASPATA
jgi:tungstate transport system substrate-binding protein